VPSFDSQDRLVQQKQKTSCLSEQHGQQGTLSNNEYDVLTTFTTLTIFIHTITGTVARLPMGKGEGNGKNHLTE
jgi:hypothetical protein